MMRTPMRNGRGGQTFWLVDPNGFLNMTEEPDQEQMVKEDLNVDVKKEIKEENDEGGVMEISAGYKGNMSDGSSNRNPPQRCPRPLDSQDPTHGGHTIPHHDPRGDLQDCTTIKLEIKEEEMEDQPPLTSLDGSNRNRNPPGRCPRPLDSQVSTQEGHTTPHHDLSEILPGIKVEDVKNEEDWSHPMVYQPCKAEEIPSEIRKAGGDGMEKSSEERSSLYSECKKEDDDVTDDSSEENSITTNHGHHSMDRLSRVHTGERTFSCEFCGKLFSRKATLDDHLTIHTGERPFPCSECNKTFARKCILTIHQRSHSKENPYPCPECGKRFRHKCNLERHRRLHNEEKLFSCSKCFKCFPMKSDLVRHLIAHSDLRAYSCPECGKCFKYRSNLQKHHLHIHRKLKRYTCTTCGKLFAEKSQLSKHQNVHRDVKPLLCTICGRTFIRKCSLKNHQKIHPL